MRRFIIGFFAILGAFVSLVMALLVAALIWGAPSTPTVADGTVLTLNLNKGLVDGPPPDALAAIFGEEQPTLHDALDALERAGADARVKGIFVRLGGNAIATAQVQELRDAIAALRAKGKFAIAYADTFGEFGPGTRAYYLGAAFDEIWLQPQGSLGLIGLRSEAVFLRGALDKLDVVPSFDHRSEYKTAMNMITERAMTPAHREETEALVRAIFDQIVRGIAKDRKLDEAAVRALIDRGPLLTDEALKAHLIDHVGYRDQAEAAARARAGTGAQLAPVLSYLAGAGHPHRSGPTIALIYGTGLITRGPSTANPLSGSGLMGADTVAHAFDLAAADAGVKAILFRVDSPGGSAVASETIWRAVQHAHDAGKPIIVSMGEVAGSGGYYVAAPADKIVAEPATLTGSIGVLAGKFVTTGLWDKIGISWDTVSAGENAALFSTLENFSPAGRERFEAFLDAVYIDFKGHVAEGRKLSQDAVESIAKGRVWSGEDAKARGLVDALGGFSTALQLAKQAAGVPDDKDVTLKLFPPTESVGKLLARLAGHPPADEETQASTLAGALNQLRTVLRQVELASAPPGSVTMPPIPVP
jgi:protease IV